MLKVVMVRHGESEPAPAGGDFAGARYDLLPLSAAGIRQITEQAEQLAASGARRVVCSPYARTLHSAAILAGRLRLPISVEIRLHDWLPVRDPMRVDDAGRRRSTREYQAYVATGALAPTRAWESPEEVVARATAVLDRYRGEEAIIVVTHELVIQLLTGRAEVPLASATVWVHP
jgi:broad specificity phosphatase PhoE